ncbi:MAG TPA: YebC/PmpR family DNA-binding transcriptional regulator [candidate division WWE3 bacterium]|uniref:YebC/PmpR family DNA-binding transcriptional regulator n=1 Tax=candidate division WWE3 bacterium TaxID=2053526 RepID=A0A7V5J297_UNCKA|nr:YebC/PmpR family DNA-binding transcriptional regulator [candidate division WWE3 bacterium]
MAGHSKWDNIKYKKQAEDAKRGKLFTKLANAITTAVKQGGGVTDPSANPSLRLAIEKAKAANMPKDRIQRAIDRALGKGGADLMEVTYECYGPGGVALMIKCATDNKNRLATQVRTVLNKYNLSLGEKGSAAYIFKGSEPSFKVPLDSSLKESLNKLVEDLNALEDVQQIIHNAE